MEIKLYIIAIDGYSSTGKSSISKEVAKHLGYIHIDTGAMYRAVTLYAMQYCTKNHQFLWDKLLHELPTLKIHFAIDTEGNNQTYLNDINVELEIRSIEVSEQVSEIAKNATIRAYLVDKQRKMGEKGGIVMDGRDIGSVVFPHADFKFFLTATVEERAKRRYLQLKEKDKNVTLEEITQNLIHRDSIDENREVAPLKILPDSIVIDNTHLSKEACIQFILDRIAF